MIYCDIHIYIYGIMIDISWYIIPHFNIMIISTWCINIYRSFHDITSPEKWSEFSSTFLSNSSAIPNGSCQVLKPNATVVLNLLVGMTGSGSSGTAQEIEDMVTAIATQLDLIAVSLRCRWRLDVAQTMPKTKTMTGNGNGLFIPPIKMLMTGGWFMFFLIHISWHW